MICVECGGPQFQILDLFAVFMAMGCYLPLFVGADLLLWGRGWLRPAATLKNSQNKAQPGRGP